MRPLDFSAIRGVLTGDNEVAGSATTAEEALAGAPVDDCVIGIGFGRMRSACAAESRSAIALFKLASTLGFSG